MNLVEFIQKQFARRRQFVFYCLIGAGGASLDFLTFSLLIKFSGSGHYQAANAAGCAVGTVFSFKTNAELNFSTRDRLAARFPAFCGVAVPGWALSANLLALLVGKFGLNVFLSKLAALFAVVLLQYHLNRRLTFRKIT